MNFSDSEIIASVLAGSGYEATPDYNEADLVLVNTCSIRENAELRVRQRLHDFSRVKKSRPSALIGIVGCMAGRLKSKLLEEEKLVDLVVGPDAYRDLPRLIEYAGEGNKAVNVLLSREETYADISPVRLNSNGLSAFVSIMRGCDNMCSFCVVPFTRGRERSRNPQTIIDEVIQLQQDGFREVTLLGQNVDSYKWSTDGTSFGFASLLEAVAKAVPGMRIRFSTSHPKDITDEVLDAIAGNANVCRHIHLPAQSGSSEVLRRMNRTYDRRWYITKLDRIRERIPECSITTDIIVGFCGETEAQHRETLTLLEYAAFDMAFMFKYSERPGTYAQRNYTDDIPEEVKSRRLSEVIELQLSLQAKNNAAEAGREYEVLVEGPSRRSADYYTGRNSQNKVIVFPKGNSKKGEFRTVRICSTTSATLHAELRSVSVSP